MSHSSHHQNLRSDYFLNVTVFALLVFGLFMLASASGPSGFKQFGDQYHFLKRQIIFGVLPGLVLFAIFINIDYHRLQKKFWWFGLATLVLLVAVFVPVIGQNYGKAQSWIRLFGLSFQPTEFVKLALIIFLSGWMVQFVERERINQAWLPFIIYMGLVGALMMMQPDLGGFLVLCLLAGVIYFLSKTPLWHFAVLAIVAGLAIGMLVKIAPYRVQRFTSFLNPENDSLGKSYQINQAKIAVGSGGLFGVGYGQSKQKYQYLPETTSDSIFAVISEELGFVVSVIIIIAYLFIFWRIWKIASRSDDLFGKLVASTIAVWFIGQAYINIGGILSLMPLTGLPLPFISNGGSSLAVSLASLGLVNNIARNQG